MVRIDPLALAGETDGPFRLAVCDPKCRVCNEARTVQRGSGSLGRGVGATRLATRFAAVECGLAIRCGACVITFYVAGRHFVRAALIIENAALRTRTAGAHVRVANRRHAAVVDVAPLWIAAAGGKQDGVALMRRKLGHSFNVELCLAAGAATGITQRVSHSAQS